MKHLSNYITLRKAPSRIVATNDTLFDIVDDEIKKLGQEANLNHIDVSQVTKMYSRDLGGLFEGVTFNGDISEWDVSNVTNFECMFVDDKIFNCDISSWNTSSAIDMSDMFRNCVVFNKDLNSWDVSNVKNMNSMFRRCEKFNKSLSNWNVSNCNDFTRMFSYCYDLKQDFSMWNINKDADCGIMFYNCPVDSNYKYKPAKLQ